MSDEERRVDAVINKWGFVFERLAATKPCSPCGDGDTEQQYHVHATGSGEDN